MAVNNSPVIIEDFFPTILELAGVRDVEQIGGVIDGRSFVSLLRGVDDQQRADRSLFWHFPNNWGPAGPGIGPSSCIRWGDWKLIFYYDGRPVELFNIAKDLGEQNNLADTYPEIRDRLVSELRAYLEGVQAQFPIEKSTGRPVVVSGAGVTNQR